MHPFADLFYPTEDFNPTACNKDTNYNSVFGYNIINIYILMDPIAKPAALSHILIICSKDHVSI
jgi:hypothetical protein